MHSQPTPGTLARTASQTLATLMNMLESELAGLRAQKSSMTGAISAAELSAAQAASVLSAQADGLRALAIGSIVGSAVNLITTAASGYMEAKGRLGAELKTNQLTQSKIPAYQTALKDRTPQAATAGAPTVATPSPSFAEKHLNPEADDSRFLQATHDRGYEFAEIPEGGIERACALADLRLKELKRAERILLQKLEFATGRLSQLGQTASRASEAGGQFAQAQIKTTEEVPAEKLKEMTQALRDLLAQIKSQFEKTLDAQARAEEALQQLLKTVTPR